MDRGCAHVMCALPLVLEFIIEIAITLVSLFCVSFTGVRYS